MSGGQPYEGFVPITLLLPGQRSEGKAWKRAGHRLLEHIELEKRSFLPVVEAEAFDLSGRDQAPMQLPVIAVNTARITAVIPGDAVTAIHTPVGSRSQEPVPGA
jgi:hypothetical protein